MELAGVGLKVEEEWRQGIKVHIFVPGVLDDRQAALLDLQMQDVVARTTEGGAEIEFVVHLGAPVGWCLAVQAGQEGPAVTGVRHLRTYPGEDGGHDVDGLGELVYDTTAAARSLRRRITNHQRNMKTLVKVAELAQQVMVPELFT